jgi:hypothetical protein
MDCAISVCNGNAIVCSAIGSEARSLFLVRFGLVALGGESDSDAKNGTQCSVDE